MSRKERRAPRAERIRGLIDAGDHRAARAEAQAVLADGSATPEDRQRAADALASLAPDRGAVAAGILGIAAAIALSAFVLLRG